MPVRPPEDALQHLEEESVAGHDDDVRPPPGQVLLAANEVSRVVAPARDDDVIPDRSLIQERSDRLVKYGKGFSGAAPWVDQHQESTRPSGGKRVRVTLCRVGMGNAIKLTPLARSIGVSAA